MGPATEVQMSLHPRALRGWGRHSLVHWREVPLGSLWEGLLGGARACPRPVWRNCRGGVVQLRATCTQGMSHHLSWGLSFPCYKTKLMINPLLSARNKSSRKLCGPPDEAHCPGRRAKERSHTCAENWQFYRETGTNIRLQKKAL